MMKSFLCSLVILSLISTGMSANQCSPSDITVKQRKTGTLVKGKPEFDVTLFNACPCPLGNVRLSCSGFQTVEPTVLVVSGGECSLTKGSLIAPFSGFVFSYAWDSEFQFKPNGASCAQ